VLAAAAVVFLNVTTVPVLPVALVTLAGLAGWVAAATLVAAMVAGARSREALAPLILLPLATPLLIAAIDATGSALAGATALEMAPAVGLLAAYDVIFVVAGFLVYGHVLEVSA
jgi:heme exporter protein B